MWAVVSAFLESGEPRDGKIKSRFERECFLSPGGVNELTDAFCALLQPMSVVLERHLAFFQQFMKTYSATEKIYNFSDAGAPSECDSHSGGGGGDAGQSVLQGMKRHPERFQLTVKGSKYIPFVKELISTHQRTTTTYFCMREVADMHKSSRSKQTSHMELFFAPEVALRVLCTMLLNAEWKTKLRGIDEIPCAFGVAMSQGGEISQSFFERRIVKPLRDRAHMNSVATGRRISGPSTPTRRSSGSAPSSLSSRGGGGGGGGGVGIKRKMNMSDVHHYHNKRHKTFSETESPCGASSADKQRDVMTMGEYHVMQRNFSPKACMRLQNVSGSLAFLREGTLTYMSDGGMTSAFESSDDECGGGGGDYEPEEMCDERSALSSPDDICVNVSRVLPGAVCEEAHIGQPKEDILFWMVLFREYLQRYMPLDYTSHYAPFMDWRAQYALIVGHMTRRGDAQNICNGPIFGSFYKNSKESLEKAQDMSELFQNLLHQCNDIHDLREHSSCVPEDMIETAREQAIQTRQRIQKLYENHARRHWRAVRMRKMDVGDLAEALKSLSRVIEYEALVRFLEGRNANEYTCVQIDTKEASMLELKASIDILLQVQPELLNEDFGSYLFLDDILVIHEGMLLVLRDISYSHAFRNNRTCTKTMPMYPIYMYMYFCTRDATSSISHSDNIAVRSVVRAIRHWITSKHTLNSWLMDVDDPFFLMYRKLHLFLGRWNTKERILEAIQESYASYKNKKPSLFTALLSFFYLRKQHSIRVQGLQEILAIVDENSERSALLVQTYPYLASFLELMRPAVLRSESSGVDCVPLDLAKFVEQNSLHELPGTNVNELWDEICNPLANGSRCYGCTKQIGCDRNCMPCVDIFSLCMSDIVNNAEARAILKSIIPPNMPVMPGNPYGRKFHLNLSERLTKYLDGFSRDFGEGYRGVYKIGHKAVIDFEEPISSMCVFLRAMEWTSLHAPNERTRMSDLQGPCEVDPAELLGNPKALPVAIDRSGMVMYGDTCMFLIVESSDISTPAAIEASIGSSTSMVRAKMYGGGLSSPSATSMVPDLHINPGDMTDLQLYYSRTDRNIDLLLQYEHTLSVFVSEQIELRQEYVEAIQQNPRMLETQMYKNLLGEMVPLPRNPQELPFSVLRDGDCELSFSDALRKAYIFEVQKRLRAAQNNVRRPMLSLTDDAQEKYLKKAHRRKVGDKHHAIQEVFSSFAEDMRKQICSRANSAGSVT